MNECWITLIEGEAKVQLSLIIKPLSNVEGGQMMYRGSRNVWSHRAVKEIKTTTGHLVKVFMFCFCHWR